MDSHTVTVSTKGQLVIPAEIREALHIQPGTRMRLVRRKNQIVIQPVRDLLDELRGFTAGGPSMTDALLKERRRDERRREAKFSR